MKKILLSVVACLALVSVASAGSETFTNNVTAKEPNRGFYKAKELNFGVYSLYGAKNKNWGGGAEVKYFVNRNLGLGVEANGINGDGAVLLNGTLRFPLSEQSRFAPYVFVGGGATNNSFSNTDNLKGIGKVGGGLEFRLSPNVGIFTDISQQAIGSFDNNSTVGRGGLNIAF